MNIQFSDLVATRKVVIYMDDILIATPDDVQEHRKVVNQVLERLQKLDLYLQPSKCYFEVKRIEFLGVILENSTVTMDPVKIAGVKEWKEPKNVCDVQKFLGFCNFYRRFIQGFSQIAKALNGLLKKGVKWIWGEAEQKAFEKLMQRDEKNILHLVAFFSKTMNEAQCNYDVYNKELLGLGEMFKNWRQYLHQAAHKVIVHTDHTNLLFWKNPGDHNRRVVRWHADLMEYDF